MKLALAITLTTISMSSFAQDRCQMRVQKLQERVDQLQTQLRYCESSNPGRQEIELLRQENYRLADQNRVLQERIDRLEGRGHRQVICASSCTDYLGNVDLKYIQMGIAYTQTEADLLSKQNVSAKYNCTYGIKSYRCEDSHSEIKRNFCTTACTDYLGNADQRYMVGGRGRNKLEAEVESMKELRAKYNCTYGVKVVSCE